MNRPSNISGSPHDSTAAPARRRPRLTWLDFFRGAAVLVMIEAHVFNTFLAAGLRGTAWFGQLTGINGLVAPSFLFIAGFVQGLERRTSPGKPIPFARRAGRLLGIAAIGYALHLPIGEMLAHRWDDALRIGTQIDVLQCLALGLGLLLGVSWLAQKFPGRRADIVWWSGVTSAALAVVLAALPVQGWMGGPVAWRAWVNPTTGSLFPIFPWIGFVFLGALAGAWPERSLPERAAGLIALYVLAAACRGTVFSAYSPSFFLERAAWVLVLATVCEWSARRPLPALVLYAGKHSLKLYVAHLVLITTLVGVGVPPAALSLPGALALYVAVAAVSLGATRFLDRLPQFLPTLPSRGNISTALARPAPEI